MKKKGSGPRVFAGIRAQRGYTLEQAALLLRVTPRYLRSIELGHTPLSYVLAMRMTRVYQCELMDLRRPTQDAGDQSDSPD